MFMVAASNKSSRMPYSAWLAESINRTNLDMEAMAYDNFIGSLVNFELMNA